VPDGIVAQGIEELAGEKVWNAKTAAAWWSVWNRLSASVARSLNVGTNLITVSLVNGDLAKMQEAAECAPRGERIHWLTSVEVRCPSCACVSHMCGRGCFAMNGGDGKVTDGHGMGGR